MENYKEFTGKSLDEAMSAACQYFGLERGKLEIEILSDSKSGIFGLVGAKKATVRARKANLETVSLKVGAESSDKKTAAKNNKPRREKAPAEQAPKAEKTAEPAAAAPEREAAPKPEREAAPAPQAKARPSAQTDEKARPSQEKRPEDRTEARTEGRSEAHGKRPNNRNRDRDRDRNRNEKNARTRHERPKQPRRDKPAPAPDGVEEKFPEIALESMDLALLEAEVLTAVDSMTRHIVGETAKEFEISGGKARVRIDSGEDSGLLIGRDGQTLSALQYLASCIVSRRMNASVRVQIDAGDYRNRQLEKLRATALELAEKVKENGKPQSTRPMSAYLRRVIHMALQEDPDVQTHSKGEGSLKRVVIVPRKK